jgi:thioredoxin 1
MKQITMFVTSWCPYCRKARNLMEELYMEHPEYKNLELKIIDEEMQPEIAKQYNYYYVPTYYVDSDKIHEGVPSKESIKNVFDIATAT